MFEHLSFVFRSLGANSAFLLNSHSDDVSVLIIVDGCVSIVLVYKCELADQDFLTKKKIESHVIF